MASYNDDVQSVIDEAYAEFGIDALLKRDGQADIACQLIIGSNTAVEFEDFSGSGRNLTDKNLLKIRKNQVDDVLKGDVISFGGDDYKVNKAPELTDRFKLEYSVRAVKVV